MSSSRPPYSTHVQYVGLLNYCRASVFEVGVEPGMFMLHFPPKYRISSFFEQWMLK